MDTRILSEKECRIEGITDAEVSVKAVAGNGKRGMS